MTSWVVYTVVDGLARQQAWSEWSERSGRSQEDLCAFIFPVYQPQCALLLLAIVVVSLSVTVSIPPLPAVSSSPVPSHVVLLDHLLLPLYRRTLTHILTFCAKCFFAQSFQSSCGRVLPQGHRWTKGGDGERGRGTGLVRSGCFSRLGYGNWIE